MKSSSRTHIALLLTVIYALIILGPLAPIMKSSAHMSANCTGECATCGCPAEQSANHTCCCWEKRRASQKLQNEQVSDCCKKGAPEGGPALRSCCPCGGNTHFTLGGQEQFALLPCETVTSDVSNPESPAYPCYRERLTSRSGAPPDPPPKVAVFS